MLYLRGLLKELPHFVDKDGQAVLDIVDGDMVSLTKDHVSSSFIESIADANPKGLDALLPQFLDDVASKLFRTHGLTPVSGFTITEYKHEFVFVLWILDKDFISNCCKVVSHSSTTMTFSIDECLVFVIQLVLVDPSVHV